MPKTPWILALTLGLVAHNVIHSERENKPATKQTQQATTEAINCLDSPSQKAQSPVVATATGNRAFVEVQSRHSDQARPEESCQTVWILHIASGGGAFSARTVAERGDPDDRESHFSIIGWSPDGDKLLAAMVVAAGDSTETEPVVYSVKERQVWRIPLAELFRHVAKAGCELYFHLLGFSSDRAVAVRASAGEKPYLSKGQEPCFAESTWWVDYHTQQVSRKDR